MKIELIAVGDELLRGSTLNSNAAWISERLARAGYSISRHTVLSDREELLEEGLREALERSDLVIATGGLGPTLDDHTKEAAARLYGLKLRRDEEVAEFLIGRFGEELETLENQAAVPEGARPLLNPIGTAPGLIFSGEERCLILLPGVPDELKKMLDEEVLPYIRDKFPLKKERHQRFLHLTGLVEADVDPLLRELEEQLPEVDLGIYPRIALLEVSFSSSDREALEHAWNEVNNRFGAHAYRAAHGKIEEAVHEELTRRGESLACAESCTGGALSAKLTALPGASDYFLGAVIAYSNRLKMRLLGVDKKTLEQRGAVSRETALEMWRGLCQKTGCDWAISLTGIAGPSGGSRENPVGTVWCAVGRNGSDPEVRKLKAQGDRSRIIEWSANSALGSLYHKLRA